MADDSMEISSEHGHNDGDGDIDIDFDFTSAQVDEDYVLEDATLIADIGEDLRPQPSPAIGNDDLMIDEDVDSYPMDDADLAHSEGGTESLHLGGDPNHGFQFGADASNSAASYMDAHQAPAETLVAENDALDGNYGDVPKQEDLQQPDLEAAEAALVPDTEKAPAELLQRDSRTPSPSQASPKTAVLAQGPTSPPASNPEHGPVSPDHTSEHYEANVTPPSLSGDDSKAVAAISLDTTTPRHSPQDVVVVYQTVEYALFSSSELDDPDSFFLSDISIAEKPMADLFKAIRQVIQEDLSDEDELCITVADLGIEADESSALLHDVTLTQILNLREKLLRNDGVESSPPLCIILGTQISFFRRLEKLTAGAAEGKGLSNFIAWDEHSESLEDLEDVDASKNGVEPNPNSHELQNVSVVQQDADAYQAALGIETSTTEEPAYDHEEEPEPGATDDTKLAPTDTVSGDRPVQHPSITDANSSSLQATKENASPSNEYYDEDDLIDYSEEEGDSVPAIQGHATVHSNDKNRTNQEYEAINEDLRRRSLSRAAEDKGHEQSSQQAHPPTGDDHDGAHGEENSIEYEEKNEHQNDFSNTDLNAGYEDFTTGEFAGALEQYEAAGLLADNFGGEGDFIDDGTFGNSFDVFGTEAQEYNYDDEGTFEDDGNRHSVEQNQAGVEDSHPGAEVTEDKPEHVDTAESSVTVDADEIQYEDEDEDDGDEDGDKDGDEVNGKVLDNFQNSTDSQVDVENEDEIDYEDEDEADKEEDRGVTTPLTTAPVLPSSNGKRSRADVESDDAMDMRSKEAKRPRS